MEDTEKLVLGLTGIAGGLGLGYIIVTKLIPSAASSDCTTPGSACYSALQPYLAQYQTCAQQYTSELQMYLTENDVNGTGLTSAQITNLNYLTQCMNTAASNIATVSKQYNIDPLATMENWGNIAIEGALILIGIRYLGPQLVTIIRSGATAASNALQSLVRGSIADGTITPASASALADSLPTVSSAIQSYDQELIDTLASEGVTSAEEASALIVEDSEALVEDFVTTIDRLISLA